MRAKTILNKVCPKCGKTVAVSPNGNRKYHCEICNSYFRERKYSVGIKRLAVAMHGLGVSYRDICEILGIGSHRNNICNWVNKYCNCKDELTEELKRYIQICHSINELQIRLNILSENIPTAKAYWEKKEKRIEKETLLDKLSRGNPYYTIYSLEIEKLHNELMVMKKPIDWLTVEQIEKEITEKRKELEKQKRVKDDLKNNGNFVNEKYDLDDILTSLKEMLAKKSRLVRAV